MIGLAILRNLIREVGRFMQRSMNSRNSGTREQQGPTSSGPQSSGRLVRDPHTGTYIDPEHAIRATVDGTTVHFESEASRDAYMKTHG